MKAGTGLGVSAMAVMLLGLLGGCGTGEDAALLEAWQADEADFGEAARWWRPIGDLDGCGEERDCTLVALGTSGSSGFTGGAEFPKAQRWAWPAVLAEQLGLEYTVPAIGEYTADGVLQGDGTVSGFVPYGIVLQQRAVPDLRTGPYLFQGPYASPYPGPGRDTLVLPSQDYPYGRFNYFLRDPCERHTGLASVGTERLSLLPLPLDHSFPEYIPGLPCDYGCQLFLWATGQMPVPATGPEVVNTFLQGFPYTYARDIHGAQCPGSDGDAAEPRTMVDNALSLEADMIVMDGALEFDSDVATFEADFTRLLEDLRTAHEDALILALGYDTVEDTAWVSEAEADAMLMAFTAGWGLPNATGVVQLLGLRADDRVDINNLVSTLLGGLMYGAPYPYTLSDPATVDAVVITAEERADERDNIRARNEVMRRAVRSVAGVYVDLDLLYWRVEYFGFPVTVHDDATGEDLTVTLTGDYGGGWESFDGVHLTRTAHAAVADRAIRKLNWVSGADYDRVDMDAVAAKDNYVLRLLGLPETDTQYDCDYEQPGGSDCP